MGRNNPLEERKMTIYTSYPKHVILKDFAFDPDLAFNLTDEQREEMESEWKVKVMKAFDEALAPYKAEIFGDGEVFMNGDCDKVLNLSEIISEVSMLDLDPYNEFYDKWVEISYSNDDTE